MPNTIPCTGRGGNKDIWGPKKHNILLCLNFELWMFLVAAWFCMLAVWLWIIAINCYLGWKNSCMINTAMSIPFFNALRRTVQYHAEFWHDLASPRLAPPKPPPPKKYRLVIWTVWILPAWAATGCSSSPPNLNVHAFTGSAESGSLEWTSAHRHRCECFVLAISLTSARSHWHTFSF